MRTWTAVGGQTMEAEFVSVSETSVTLRNADGKTILVPLVRLDEASREQAKALSAEQAGAAGGGGSPVEPGGKTASSDAARKALGLPTDAEIEKFLTSLQLPDQPERYEFSASFVPATVSAQDKKKYARSGKVPFRITVELRQLKEVKGRQVSMRMDGRGGIFILDEAGEIVDRTRESLGKLCPS